MRLNIIHTFFFVVNKVGHFILNSSDIQALVFESILFESSEVCRGLHVHLSSKKKNNKKNNLPANSKKKANLTF